MALREIYETTFDEDSETQTTTVCPECTGTIRETNGERTCSECGLVVSEYRIDHAGPRTFSDDEHTQRRTGAPLTNTRHDRGLSTEIGYGRDGNGNTLSGAKRRQLSRLRREQRRGKWRSTQERNLAHGCGEITRLTGALDLPEHITERASTIFRTAQKEGLLPGRSIESIAAGCVYAACRCEEYTRTLEEVAAQTHCEQSTVTNGYRILNRELGLATVIPSPQTYLPRISSACDSPATVTHRARKLCTLAEEGGLHNGRCPRGVAAACLYQAVQEQSTEIAQQTIAAAADTTPVTLRTRYQELQEILDE